MYSHYFTQQTVKGQVKKIQYQREVGKACKKKSIGEAGILYAVLYTICMQGAVRLGRRGVAVGL